MSFSLLRPSSVESGSAALPPETVHDLGLEEIARDFAKTGGQDATCRRLLTHLPTSSEEIKYRQGTTRALWHNRELCSELEEAHESLKELTMFGRSERESDRPFLVSIWRLGELELYVELVKKLRGVLKKVPEGARALSALAAQLDERMRDPVFAELERELPRLRDGLKLHQSVTIGINLDDRMRPVEAALLSINPERYKRGQFLSGFLGKATGNPYVTRTTIHQNAPTDPFSGEPQRRLPLSPLFDELDGVLRSMLKPLARELKKFVTVSTQLLRSLVPELGFFLAAIRYLRELSDAGYPLSLPEVLPVSERYSRFEGLYNLRLARHWMDNAERMVGNDVELGSEARLYVLTGPNGGGKTTFTQALGIATIFAQAGLPVPAREAAVSPVDAILTHFPAEEMLEDEIGRFEEEARRVSGIFDRASGNSLVLLNEPLSSTSPGEAERIASTLLRGFRFMGARGIFTTHFHGLALEAEHTNRTTHGTSAIGTLNAQTLPAEGTVARTYRIVAGPPVGTSYAADIARRYEIDETTLFERIRKNVRSLDQGTA